MGGMGLSGKWCSGGDSNPHGLPHMPLKHACLPFHHPSTGRGMTVVVDGREDTGSVREPQAFSIWGSRIILREGPGPVREAALVQEATGCRGRIE